ncbi:pre-mRNA-splicing factor 38B isoform X1 [Chiloscyllium punctatum]|uniref:Pre-mRNA-splicing factor 38B n=3 Tax=Chiloscyllium punctatum TaxID=137246 RepID=A0A401SNN6_CHIPU|nr:hypothetical protein [Chiloscyllium punctatum]
MANKTAIGNHQQQQQQAGGSVKPASSIKQGNVLPLWGNEKTMNLNPLILTNILSSPYFKVQLYELKTYHEVVDEIYFKVTHIEPWEKGSRKTAGQTGMCGGVRGVGTGGIVSTAFCLLYKLFTLKLTRKQVMGLITHTDSPYIRGLGFMYIRYTQPPADLWDWYEPFLDDEEELDVKAGGGCVMTIGEMIRSFLTKLEWFSTLFPRIPVPVQKNLDQYLKTRPRKIAKKDGKDSMEEPERLSERRHSRSPRRSLTPRKSPRRSRSRSRHREGHGSFGFDKELERERERQKREREQIKDRERSEKDRHKSRSTDRGLDRRRSRSRDHHRSRSRDKRSTKKDREREKENERSRRRDKDYEKDKERVSDRDRDRNVEKDSERSRDRDKRSQSKTEDRKRKEEKREKDEKRHKDDKKDSKKDKRHSRSRSREKRHRSNSPGRGHVSKRSRSKSKEKSKHRNEHKEKSNKRSISRERTDENNGERIKKQRSHSKEKAHKRSQSKERSHKQGHSDGKDHSSKLSRRSLSTERENKSNAEGLLQGNTTDND